MRADKKSLDFELNLVPFIDLMSVLITFLLLTTVWELIGSMDLKQASGSKPMLTDQTPVLVFSLSGNNLQLQLKNGKQNLLYKFDLNAKNLKEALNSSISRIKSTDDTLDAAVVLSSQTTSYQQIVSAIEVLKHNGFKQVGLSSL